MIASIAFSTLSYYDDMLLLHFITPLDASAMMIIYILRFQRC